MSSNYLFSLSLIFFSFTAFSQDIDTQKLDKLFNALENRNEAMGSIAISKNGQLLYTKAIGYQYISGDTLIPANSATHYRIWSITKTYTTTLIFQLIEEGSLSLTTTLDTFFPNIPNAHNITIEQMLSHKSGIHDFIQNNTSEDWDTHIKEPITPDLMVNLIASYPADFEPSSQFQYSNSNYLLLGYLIEKLDNQLLERSFANRIFNKIGLKHTYYKNQGINQLENKAYTYRRGNQWKIVDEGTFSGPIPAAAGGIIASPTDMTKFIAALFSGQLISKKSLEKMLEMEGGYKLGIMETYFKDKIGFGHTGGSTSESSLFYYPADSLAIAYCTNGIVLRKEEILNNVLKIYHRRPFDVSMDRKLLSLTIISIFLILAGLASIKFKHLFTDNNLLNLGIIIFGIFWIGALISGWLNEDYDFKKEGITELGAFYSTTGDLMSSTQIIVSILSLLFSFALYQSSRKKQLSILPTLPILFFPISMLGAALFPFPSTYYSLFSNLIIFTFLGPFLALLLWRVQELKLLKLVSFICLILIIIGLGLMLSRPSNPEFVHNYFGLLQRVFFAGLTLWLLAISILFPR